MNTATISFRTDPQVKKEAQQLYASMGMDLSTALNVFLRQSLVEGGIPFKITQDRAENIEARRQADEHDGKTFSSTDNLMRDLLDA